MQNEEEYKAQLEDNAEKQIADEAQVAMLNYIHSHLEHFQRIDDCTSQAVLPWHGKFIICTFYRDIDDLMDDSWKLLIEDIAFVMVENADDITLQGEQVMGIEEGAFDSDEDE